METWLKTVFEYLYISIGSIGVTIIVLAIRTVISYFLEKEIEKFNVAE